MKAPAREDLLEAVMSLVDDALDMAATFPLSGFMAVLTDLTAIHTHVLQPCVDAVARPRTTCVVLEPTPDDVGGAS